MAHDLLSGQQDGRDWSRGDGLREWATRRAVDAAGKKIPWIPIAIGAATVGVFFLLPSRKGVPDGYHARRRSTEPTLAIPHESMRELVHGKRR